MWLKPANDSQSIPSDLHASLTALEHVNKREEKHGVPLRWCVVFIGVLILMIPGWSLHAQSSTSASEYALKAAYLYKLFLFLKWDSPALADPSTPYRLCVMGIDPFGRVLDALEGEVIKGRRLRLTRIRGVDETMGCHVVFISMSEQDTVGTILTALRHRNVLTVGDMDGFAEKGGGLQFVKEHKHIRFLVNLDATRRAGLHISSKLLRLAKIFRKLGDEE